MPLAAETHPFAHQLLSFRRLHIIKQATLAEMLGVDQATISRWETGRMVPDRRMQQRFQNLVRRQPSDEALLKHWTTSALGEFGVFTKDRVILAASRAYALNQGVAPDEIVGLKTTPQHTAESERCYRALVEHGFFRGDVVSVLAIARANSLSGHARNRVTKAIWSATRISDDQVVLRTERVSLGENEYAAALEQNGGNVRVVTMDDLVD